MTYFDQETTGQRANAQAPSTPPPPGEERAVVRLAAKMAHELNNPLDAVLRFVSLAQRKAKSGEFGDLERHLNDAQFGLQRMTEILRELMEIGRQSHEILGRPQPVPVADLLAQAIRTVQPLAEQRHIQIALERTGVTEGPGGPRSDLRAVQVLANLVKNAVEASPEQSVVVVTARVEGGRLLLTVQDSGPGIEPSVLPQLFMPFVTTKPRGTGHGLGLIISRELVTGLGGTVSIQNRPAPERGCIATVCLPV